MPSYEGLKPGEQTILVIRRHWWFFVKLVVYSLILLLIAMAIIIFVKDMLIVTIVSLLTLAIIAGLTIYYRYLWKHDVYVLTDQRIIDINRTNIFQKDVTEFSLDKIQNVTYNQHGPIPMMVNFGEVIIETAGEFKNVKIELAPNPSAIQQKVSQTFQTYRTKYGFVVEKENKIDLHSNPESV
ncbi:MAG: hypothetical protein ACD_58C00038G0006 [uncultured bacterium]|nr:MAG: hypothetical protein ACD_58C00038G0006 [uncultured bacterium]